MRKVNLGFYSRVGLALVAMIIAGSGAVSAIAPNPNYPTPRTAQIQGPTQVVHNGVGLYQLYVTFVDGSSGVYGTNDYAQVQWSAVRGHFATNGSGTIGTYFAPSTVGAGRDVLSATFAGNGGYVSATRTIGIN
jgi:hypothetical protein